MPAIVFDFDGVIVDSEPMHEAAIRGAVRELGMDFSPEEYRTRYLGLDDRDIYAAVARASGRELGQREIAKLFELKWEHAQRQIAGGGVRPFAGSVELLRAACEAGPTAICSGALRREIDLILGALGVGGLVTTITSADEVAKSKPDPASYVLTAQRLGLPARECIAIEDTGKGVRSARGAGLMVVGVCHSMAAQELSEADVVVGSTAELSVNRLLGMLAQGVRTLGP
jgi:beta-phosphoglucomutase